MEQTRTRKKLIEVALPLDKINAASAREKSIRHGHPSTLHLWWARRPLAAARAVLFAQLVDDPSDLPEEFPNEEAQTRERARLFEIIEELVLWKNTTNERVLEAARAEIRKSWRRTCADNRDHPRAAELFDPERLPAFHDPFAGGGAIPLEAQRLGLESYASDLNPVAVLINKAMIEIPPKFAGRPPVNPVGRSEGRGVRSERGRDVVALSKDDSVAEGDGGGARGLSFGAEAAARGDVRDAFADHARGGIGSSQYRGGLDAGDAEGESAVSGNRAGVSGRDGDAADAVRRPGLVSPKPDRETAGIAGRGESNADSHAAPAAGALTSRSSLLFPLSYPGATGLAEDVRHYGQWMRDEAEKRIGHLYPQVEVTEEMAAARPDLKRYVGRKLTVIAWLWARTVRSPNPAFAEVEVPLASTFILSKKKGREAYVEPVIEEGGYRFTVKTGKPPEAAQKGTKLSRGSNFQCVLSGVPMNPEYIRSEGMAGRMRARLMAIVAEGDRGRIYLAPIVSHEEIPREANPDWKPETAMPDDRRWFSPPPYGMPNWADLFTDRQLVALTTFSDLMGEARERIRIDAAAAGLPDNGVPLRDGGAGATAYAEAVGVYLGICVSRQTNRSATLNFWDTRGGNVQQVFARQALAMTWDFAESNPLSSSSGNFTGQVGFLAKVLEISISSFTTGSSDQLDAQSQEVSVDKLVSTDPPYYDNIGYADLSDFFYVWLRRSLRQIYPELFATLSVPKLEELVATPYRHDGSKEKAESFFMDGMTKAMRRLAEQTHPAVLATIYYAFKQSEHTKGRRARPALDGRHSWKR